MKLPMFNTPPRPQTDPERNLAQTGLPASFEPASESATSQTNPASPLAASGENDHLDTSGMQTHLLEGTALDPMRTAVLHRLLLVAVLLGLLASALSLLRLLQPGTPTGTSLDPLQWATLGLNGLAWTAVIVAVALHRMTYTQRAALLLLALFAMGMAALLTEGLSGSGPVILVGIPFIAAILSGKPGRIASLALSLSGLILVGVLILAGAIPMPQNLTGTGMDSVLPWVSAIITFSLLVVVGGISLGRFLDGLQQDLAQKQALASHLASKQSELEIRAAERANDLQRRLIQIRTVAEINRAISQVLDTDLLLPQVCELVRQRFDLYYVGVFLIEQGSHAKPGAPGGLALNAAQSDHPASSDTVFAVLRAGSGEAGRKMLAEGHKLAVGGDSMIGWATAHGQPRISQNVSQEGGANVIARFNNPHLPLTRSELALPIQISETNAAEKSLAATDPNTRILGAMTIQSTQERAFDQDDIVILQGIADSLASAIENARLFKATQASLEEIRALHRQYLEQAWSLETALRGEIAYSYENDSPSPPGLIGMSPAMSDEKVERQLEIPIRLRDQVIGSLTLEAAAPEMATEGERPPWTAEDLALIEAVTNQAALALENARLLEETRRKVNLEHTAASITSKLWASADIEAILRTALQELGNSLGARHGSIELWPIETLPEDSRPFGVIVSGSMQHSGEEVDASD